MNLFLIAREIAARKALESIYIASTHNPAVPLSASADRVIVYQWETPPWPKGLAARVGSALKSRMQTTLVGGSSIWFAPPHPTASLYHFRCGGPHLASAIMRCRAAGARVVFTPAHIQDCTLEWLYGLKRRALTEPLYLWGLRHVDLVICHAEYLSRAIEDKVRCPVETVYAGHPVPPEPGPKDDPPLVLYVGRMEKWKRPELFLDLAEALSGTSARFVMVGGPTPGAGQAFYERIRARAQQIPGLDFKGALPLPEVENLFERASLFVSTSESEGFPNTFIQAWLRGVPTASLLVNPDGLIDRHGLGMCANGDFASLVRWCRDILENVESRRTLGAQARAYAVVHHDIRETARRHEELYLKLLSARR